MCLGVWVCVRGKSEWHVMQFFRGLQYTFAVVPCLVVVVCACTRAGMWMVASCPGGFSTEWVCWDQICVFVMCTCVWLLLVWDGCGMYGAVYWRDYSTVVPDLID